MKDEIKEMLEYCDKDELVEDLSYPEMQILKDSYSFEVRAEASLKLINPTVHKFIEYCEKWS